MEKPRICLIGYGGTIVMIVDEIEKVVKPADNVEEILNAVPRIKDQAHISLKVLSNVDSTNVIPEDWTRISNFILREKDNFDAFVIAHGTNTLSYTASALSFSLGKNFGKPVILTGSQLPLTVFGSDGVFNLENSVKVAKEAIKHNIDERMIVFDDLILRGCRSVKVSESDFRAFNSPALEPIGKIVSTGIIFNSFHIHKKEESAPDEKQNLEFSSNVVCIDLTPGQDSSMIKDMIDSNNCKGLLLKSHGAGSVPSEGKYSLLPVIEYASHDKKIPVCISTKFLGGNSYKEVNDEPAKLALNAGAIPTGDMTDVAGQVKLMWLLGQGITDLKELKRLMMENFVGEITPIN